MSVHSVCLFCCVVSRVSLLSSLKACRYFGAGEDHRVGLTHPFYSLNISKIFHEQICFTRLHTHTHRCCDLRVSGLVVQISTLSSSPSPVFLSDTKCSLPLLCNCCILLLYNRSLVSALKGPVSQRLRASNKYGGDAAPLKVMPLFPLLF